MCDNSLCRKAISLARTLIPLANSHGLHTAAKPNELAAFTGRAEIPGDVFFREPGTDGQSDQFATNDTGL